MQPFTLSIGSNDNGVFLRAVGKRTQCCDEAPQRGSNATRETRFNVDVDSDLQDFLSRCTRVHRRCVFNQASSCNGSRADWNRIAEFTSICAVRSVGSKHCSWRASLSISRRIGKPFVFRARFSQRWLDARSRIRLAGPSTFRLEGLSRQTEALCRWQAYKEFTMTWAVFRASAMAVSDGLAEPMRVNKAGPATKTLLMW